ncbi:UDP-N-acetylglucosamine 2-epimerase [Chitinophaga sp. MM2321]|uniref:UDP-N-acetylglucosamine 2-epimerase n=1 Tax=Chitinophaga sp. MM2321 TaxID=3137178 RepID=UPI0032D5AB29
MYYNSYWHALQTAEMMLEMEQVVIEEKPDAILVYRDTNSILANTLVAFKLHISVSHIEADSRRFNRDIPEEINRVLMDHVSELLFCLTEMAVKRSQCERN